MTVFEVTLAELRKQGACFGGYNKLVRYLQGLEFSDKDAVRHSYIKFYHDKPISLLSILDSNGFDDALWALCCVPNSHKNKDIRLFAVWCARQVEHLMEDPRSKKALQVAEDYANGLASDSDLDAARDAAWDAARDAARDAAWAAARDAAWAAAWAADWDAARDAQEKKFREMITLGFFN